MDDVGRAHGEVLGGSARGDDGRGRPAWSTPGLLVEVELVASEESGGVTVAVRVIPCLDVDAGRVVKGVNFLDLRDAGDPVELARSTTPRAPTS